MGQQSLPGNTALYLEDGFWKLNWDEEPAEAVGGDSFAAGEESGQRHPVWVGLATGPKGLSRDEAQQIVWRMIVSQARAQKVAHHSSMTLVEFVETKFVPEYVASKGFAGRMHYQSMLKHVLRPEEVDRVFRLERRRPKARLRAVADWPYLGHVPLRDMRPELILHLTAAALESGYSEQTVTHIRNVVSTIFSYAQAEMHFSGKNPASAVKLRKVCRPGAKSMAVGDVVRMLALMRYPEKEMTLFAALTGMTVAEICGLQWKRVNLTDAEISNDDGEAVPAKTLLIREEWTRGQLGAVSKRRIANVKIPGSLLRVLSRLRGNSNAGGGNEFVLTSRSGSPVNQTNILTRRLKPIGVQINIPGLSWHMIRRIRKELTIEYGAQFPERMAGVMRAAFRQDFDEHESWRGQADAELPY
jgi:integrase